jgi:hypothetical protein
LIQLHGSGNYGFYHSILKDWLGNKHIKDATLFNLIEILRKEGFMRAADLLENLPGSLSSRSKVSSATLDIPTGKVTNISEAQAQDNALRISMVLLSQKTGNWPGLKMALFSCGLLTSVDIQIIESQKTEPEQFFMMYMILKKQPNWFEKLMPCLQATNNKHIADILIEATNKALHNA